MGAPVPDNRLVRSFGELVLVELSAPTVCVVLGPRQLAEMAPAVDAVGGWHGMLQRCQREVVPEDDASSTAGSDSGSASLLELPPKRAQASGQQG